MWGSVVEKFLQKQCYINKDYNINNVFKWSLKYKSTHSSTSDIDHDIANLIIGLNLHKRQDYYSLFLPIFKGYYEFCWFTKIAL